MKTMTRRTFLKTSGAVLAAAVSGTLTACSGGGGGGISVVEGGGEDDGLAENIGEGTVITIDASNAKQIDFVKADANGKVVYPKNNAVGPYKIYPIEAQLGKIQGYGLIAEIAVNIANHSESDLELTIQDTMVRLNGQAAPILGMEGGDDAELDGEWGSSVRIRKTTENTDERKEFENSRTVYIYADARGKGTISRMDAVIKLESYKVKIQR